MKFRNETEFEFGAGFGQGFTVVPNEILNDNRLSFKALGLYTQILQFRNSQGHKIYMSALANSKKDKDASVTSAMKELIDLGYIERVRLRNEKGHVKGMKYIVHVRPSENTTFEPILENPVQENHGQENHVLKKKINKKENNKKENKDVVVGEKEKQLLKMYKSFKLEKRFMPHSKKLLLEFKDCFDLEVFEQVFIYASSEKVTHKYKYLKDTFTKLRDKNISTLEQYENDAKEFKESKKQKNYSKGSSAPKVKTKFHNINETYSNYSPDELKEVIKESQKNKFKTAQDTKSDKSIDNKNKTSENVNKCTINTFALSLIKDRCNIDVNNMSISEIIETAASNEINLRLNESTNTYELIWE